MDNNKCIFQVAVYDPENDTIVVDVTSVTAVSAESARLKVVRGLPEDLDLDKAVVTVVPFG